MALHRSLLRHGGDFTLHVLCLDDATRKVLSALALPHANLIALDTLEAWAPSLRAVRPGRAPAEFYFTCKPVLLDYLLDQYPNARRLTYLDSDLYYFSDAIAAEVEFGLSPVALTPHRFSDGHAFRLRYGRFNAGWVSINTTVEARSFVAWWRERCLEWCHLRVEETRFGDQKYLDQVPELFPGTAILTSAVNIGPWNLDPRRIKVSAKGVTIDDAPLIAFHFHNLRRTLFDIYDCGLHEYDVPLTPEVREDIYEPYLRELAACHAQARALNSEPRTVPSPLVFARRVVQTVRAVARDSAIRAAA